MITRSELHVYGTHSNQIQESQITLRTLPPPLSQKGTKS